MKTLALVKFILSLSLIEANDKLKYDPGNTYTNCVPQIRCTSCHFYRLRCGFRTIDGTCNNLKHPRSGGRNTPLKRLLRADYVDGFDTPRGFPGTKPIVPPANEVSEKLFHIEHENRGTRELAVMFMTFGQFLDHDISLASHIDCHISDCSSPDAFKYPCFPILFRNGGKNCTGFARALPVCQRHIRKKYRRPRNQINELTAFIDGSQIYGSFFRIHQRLRRQDGTGTLKLNDEGLMELDSERLPCRIFGGCSLVGDSRGDENLALHSMHTLWVREHNRIAKELKKVNPDWDDEELYQNARKINGAQLQHIVYNEWLPHIVRLRKYRGYNKRLNPSISNAFTTAAFRFGHSLIPNKFSQLDKNFDNLYEPVTLQEAFRNRMIINVRGIEPTIFGLIGNRSNDIDNRFAFGIARKLFIRPGAKGHMDLTAFNIQRGRDHGIATYGKWRRACRLPVPKTFAGLEKYMIKGTVQAFKKLYKSPKDIDLFAAGISEKHVKGLHVGPTFECLFRYQFTRLRDGDRFFYRAKGVFTKRQFDTLKKVSMAKILCNNLKGIVSVQPKVFIIKSEKNKPINCDRLPDLDFDAWNY